jgi:hypothetical protein
MAELQAIIDAIVTVQNAITPPTGEKGVTVYDEPPEVAAVYPSFINVERETEELSNTVGRRGPIVIPYIIDMHLIFGAFDKKYSYRSKRKWVQPVHEAIATNLKLGGTVKEARLQNMDFHPNGLTYGEIEYHAVTFTLRAVVHDLTVRSA